MPPQLIYKGKTPRCHPTVEFPERWDVWHTDNQWANEQTTKRYIDLILLPFINRKCQELKLAESHPALVLFDCFKGQTTEDVQQMLLENNIHSVQIPANCTDKLQPMDVSINKPMKNEIKRRFQEWYASEVQRQLSDNIPIHEVKVNVTLTNIKG